MTMAYTIEEEQEINEIKTWWKENYKGIITIFVLTMAAVFGWRYWQNYQIEQTQLRSMQYEAVIADIDSNKAVDNFVKSNGETTYAVFVLLDQARNEVIDEKFAEAEKSLTEALNQSQDDILTSISALRLAAVQYQLGKYEQALATLKQVKGKTWEASKLILSGDIQIAQGNKDAAKATFEQALKIANDTQRPMIEVRFNNLS